MASPLRTILTNVTEIRGGKKDDNAVTGDVIKIAAVWRMWDFSQCVNTFHIKLDEDGDDIDVMGSVVDWLEAGYGEFLGVISNTVAAEKVEGFNITQGNPMPVLAWNTITGGTSVGSRLPNGVCCLTNFRTGVSNVVGKKYWPPFTEADLDAGLWSNALLINVNDGAAIFEQQFTPVAGISFTPGVYRPSVLNFVPFISSLTSPEPAYQRRRKPGRGS